MASIWDITNPTAASATPTYNAPQPWGGGDLFYNGGNYGQNQDWFNSSIGENIREENQNLAYGSWASRMGIANNDQGFNRWFYNQFPRFQQAYGQATMDNPLMTIDDFIATLPGYTQLQNEYAALDPVGRGAQYNRVAPNVRWINR